MDPKLVNSVIRPIVRRIAFLNNLEVVDIFNFMGGRALLHHDYFNESIHSNDKGYEHMARFLAQSVLNPQVVTPVLQDKKISVVCAGDSITAVSTLLGPDFVVQNLGNSGKTMMKSADFPYWNTETFQQLLKTSPDIVTIMFGTNDGKNHNWFSNSSEQYFNDYSEFIKIIQGFESKPIIHLMVPPPLYIEGVFGMNRTLMNHYVHDLVPKIAAANQVNGAVINIFDLLGGEELFHPEYISDGCHPTNLGYYQVAKTLADVVIQDKLSMIQNGPEDVISILDPSSEFATTQ